MCISTQIEIPRTSFDLFSKIHFNFAVVSKESGKRGHRVSLVIGKWDDGRWCSQKEGIKAEDRVVSGLTYHLS